MANFGPILDPILDPFWGPRGHGSSGESMELDVDGPRGHHCTYPAPCDSSIGQLITPVPGALGPSNLDPKRVQFGVRTPKSGVRDLRSGVRDPQIQRSGPRNDPNLTHFGPILGPLLGQPWVYLTAEMAKIGSDGPSTRPDPYLDPPGGPHRGAHIRVLSIYTFARARGPVCFGFHVTKCPKVFVDISSRWSKTGFGHFWKTPKRTKQPTGG